MLFKLSQSSMRKSYKDYLVLLFGLTISIAIFYMFQTLAQNKAFIESNAMITSIEFIFHIGTFILAAITVFYIFYATSFMIAMRQKEMGMYMMLGAKKHKVTQLMFFETFFIGIVSLVIGIVIGIGMAQGIASLFMWQLDFEGEGFEAFYLSSMITTIIFYVILFLLTSIVNAVKIAKKSVLDLLHADRKQDNVKSKGSLTIIGVLFSILLIGIGYYAMMNIDDLKEMGIILAATTITLGTYLIFISLLPYLVEKLKGIRSLNEQGINSFTLAQLRFRMLNLTKVLGTVAMLVALGLGAMTAGISFYINIEKQAGMMYANDLAIHQPSDQDKQTIEQLNTKEENFYRYKIDDKSIYFLKDDLVDQPPLSIESDFDSLNDAKSKRVATPLPDAEYTAENMPGEWYSAITNELNASYYMVGNREAEIVDQTNFGKIQGDEEMVVVATLDNYTTALPQLEKLETGQKELAESLTGETPELTGTKYNNYLLFKGMSSGTVFMGLFLGVAFLMMMASVLMFKLLASANADVQRYNMLRKIGVRKSLLIKSIYRELFLLFLFPALVGLTHVIIGMQMFASFLVDPYTKIWVPIGIFLLIYGIYYLLTVQMYKRIVLPKEI